MFTFSVVAGNGGRQPRAWSHFTRQSRTDIGKRDEGILTIKITDMKTKPTKSTGTMGEEG